MRPPTTAGSQGMPVCVEPFYYVMYRGQPIGSSRLEGSDPAMGVAFGSFEPLPAYEAVRTIFQLFTEAEDARMRGDTALGKENLAAYNQASDALQLTLQTADGHVIPTSWIHIVDWADLGREVEVQISDTGFWQEHQRG
jgi:hypothetical protein